MSGLETSLIVWSVEATIVFSVVGTILKRMKTDYKLLVTFLFITILWSSLKIVDEYKYIAIGKIGEETGNDQNTNYAVYATLAYGIALSVVRYPTTFFSAKYHAKTLAAICAAGLVGLMSTLTTMAMLSGSAKISEIMIICSSATLGIVYGMFTTASTLVANRNGTKDAFKSVLIIVMSYFTADAFVSPIKAIVREELVYGGGWEGFWIMWMLSAVFAILAVTIGLLIKKWEPHPHYDKKQKIVFEKIRNSLGKDADEYKIVNVLGYKRKVKYESSVWWNKLLILSVVGFSVVLMNGLLSSSHFGSFVMLQMFESVKTPYPELVAGQLTAFFETVYTLFSFLGFVFAVYWLIPKTGFKGTIMLGISMIMIYGAIGSLNMFDENLRSPVLMFTTYGLLGAGYGIVYYSMVSMMLLMEVANPSKNKFSGIGIWLLITGPAVLIAELIFATSALNTTIIDPNSGQEVVDFDVFGILMVISLPIGAAMLIWIDKKLDNKNYGSLFEQTKPTWQRTGDII